MTSEENKDPIKLLWQRGLNWNYIEKLEKELSLKNKELRDLKEEMESKIKHERFCNDEELQDLQKRVNKQSKRISDLKKKQEEFVKRVEGDLKKENSTNPDRNAIITRGIALEILHKNAKHILGISIFKSPQTKHTLSVEKEARNDDFVPVDTGQMADREIPKVIILDNNPVSIANYAEEFPENWKKICEALDKDTEIQEVRGR